MNKILFICLILLSGCSLIYNTTHDEQFVQVQYYQGYNEINTFTGILIKDLIPGKARTSFGFTKHEQELTLAKMDSVQFYSLPDTLIGDYPIGYSDTLWKAASLRIKYGNKDKTVICNDSVDKYDKQYRRFITLFFFINNIARSKQEYKDLPETKGSYL